MLNLKLRAKNLVKKYGTSDPYYIARELKFEIVFCDMPYKINGMWRRILRRKYIFIDENLNEWQKKAVLCHELGHFYAIKVTPVIILLVEHFSKTHAKKTKLIHLVPN